MENGLMDGHTDGWMHRQKGGWVDGWMDGWNGQMSGWTTKRKWKVRCMDRRTVKTR